MVSLRGEATINLQQMKKIEAVILSSNLNAVRKGLECRGIRSGIISKGDGTQISPDLVLRNHRRP